MTMSVDRFWELAAESGLVSQKQLLAWKPKAAEIAGIASGSQLAKWLVQHAAITPYHAIILLAERPGPFAFGEYLVTNRSDTPELRGQFLARHRPSRHPVLLDFLADDWIPTDQELVRITQLARRHIAVDHPALSDCYELVELASYKFLVLEAPAKSTLASLIAGGASCQPARAFQWTATIADGLASLHQVGLVHGAVLPENVAIEQGQPRLMRHPWRNAVMDNVAKQTDIQDLGRLLPTMLTGTLPSSASGDEATQQSLASLSSVKGLNEAARSIVRRMLSSNEEEQFTTADDVVTAIASILPPLDAKPPAVPATRAAYLQAIKKSVACEEPMLALPEIEESAAPAVAEIPSIAAEQATLRYPAKSSWWPVSLSVATLAVCGVLVARSLWAPVSSATRPLSPQADTTVVDSTFKTNVSARYVAANDDGRLLWMPPTDGEEVDFRYAPQGAQFLLVARPAAMLAVDEGSRVLAALGPEFAALQERWEAATGITIGQLDQLTVGIVPDANNRPAAVCAVKLVDGHAPDDLAALAETGTDYPQGKVVEHNGQTWLIPTLVDPPREFVVGPQAIVVEIANRESPDPILRREFETLRHALDKDRHFAVLATPSYLLRDGRGVFSASYRDLPDVVDGFFGDGVRALLLSGHLTEQNSFFELRLAVTADMRRPLYVGLPQKISNLPATIESHVASLSETTTNHWQPLSAQFGNMLRFLAEHIRYGLEREHVVMNASLPSAAAHNLLLAAELTVAAGLSTPSESDQPANTVTLEKLLTERMDWSIQQLSLESAMREFATQLNDAWRDLAHPIKIHIDGPGLEQEGITRNQQIRDFGGEGQTVADLLTGLVMRANPDQSVAEPNDLNQRLVWVIVREGGPDNSNNPFVLITTRQAAEARKLVLPSVFQSK